MNSTYQPNETYEVDLHDFFRQILMQWRALLACGLVFALLMGCAMYVRDVNDAKKNQAAEQAHPVETSEEKEDADKARKRLTDTEAAAVEKSRTDLLTIFQSDDYMKNSVKMRLDPYHEHVLTIQYYIEEIPTEKATILCEAYTKQLTEDSYVTELRSALGCSKDVDIRYVRELVSAWYSGTTQTVAEVAVTPIITVQVILPDGVEGVGKVSAGQCADSVDKCMQAIRNDLLASVGQHQLTQVSRFEKEQVDNTLWDQIYRNNTSAANLRSIVRSDLQNYSKDQKIVLRDEVAKLQKAYPDADAFEIKMDETDTSAATTASTSDAAEVIEPAFRLRNFLIGFVFGLILYILLYAIYVHAKGRLITKDEMGDYTGLPVFGEIHSYEGRAKGAFGRFLWDRRLYEHYYGKYLSGHLDTVEEMAAKAASTLSVEVKDASTVLLLSLEGQTDSASGEIRAVANALTGKFAMRVDVDSISIEEIEMNIGKVKDYGGIILAGQRMATRRNDVRRFRELAEYFNIPLVGSCFFE